MKRNVAGQAIGAQMTTISDGSNFTGAVTVWITIDNGSQTQGSVGSGACTHEGNGYHSYAPAQAETDGAHIAFTFVGSGAITATVQVYPTFPQTGDNFARLGAPAGASVSADVAAVKSDTGAILADTGTDGVVVAAASKTGYSLTQAFPTNFADLSISATTGLVDITQAAADKVWGTAARTLTAFSFAVDISATAVSAIWDKATSALTTAGSIGKLLVDNINATIASRATPAQVNTEVVDALNTDTYAQPGQEAPAATTTIVKMASYLYKAWRNKIEQTDTTYSLYADDGTTVDQKATTSDNGTTFTKGEVATGP